MIMRKALIALILLGIPLAPLVGQTGDAVLLDTLQHTAFNFFWNEANPANGLIKDRSSSGSPCSIASVGFGLSAICIGVDHGWVSRPAARDRVLTTLKTLLHGRQGSGDGFIGQYGLFYHFLDMTTATRAWSSELSSIDTGLLLAGIVDARQYFDQADSIETSIRSVADSIYYRMNWDLMRNFNPGIIMAWMPGTGFLNYGPMRGYYEASIVYILAMGSPTFGVDASAWQYWTSGYNWSTQYGYSYVIFPPLFGHQYSHCYVDFRNIADDYMRAAGITYFENSRRATLAQRAYSIANPGGFPGYSDSLWGITASDAPTGYSARGAPPAQNDDGTIAPTAPIGSIAFAPEVVLPVIRNMWNNYRPQLWMKYGFRDAFNLKVNWWDTDVIGIDQGPIILMIENYRTQAVWKRFMKNADVQRGLQVGGFLPLTSVTPEGVLPSRLELWQNFPNPFNPSTTIRYELPSSAHVRLAVYDVLGVQVALLADGVQEAGRHLARFDGSGSSSGLYFCRLESQGSSLTRKLLLMK
jgi:hypothetical protein